MEFESSWISHNEENRVHIQLNNFKVEDGSTHDPNEEASLQDDTCYICLLFDMPRRRRTVNAASTWIRVTPEGARTSHFVHVRFVAVPSRFVLFVPGRISSPGEFQCNYVHTSWLLRLFGSCDAIIIIIIRRPSNHTFFHKVKMAMKIYGELEVCVI